MRVLITGAGGQLGRELGTAFASRGADVVPLTRAQLDVGDRAAVLAAVEGHRPALVVNAAAWTAVDACEADPDRAFRDNAMAVRYLVEASARIGTHLVQISTDYVFDGRSARPYHEWDSTNPQSVYGHSKLGGEVEAGPTATIVRTSWVCGRHGGNFVKTMLRLAAERPTVSVVDDQHGTPTFADDLASTVAVLGTERLRGRYHVTNQGATTWFAFARAIFEAAGHDPERVLPISTAELDPPRPAPRPAYSVLDNVALRSQGLPLLPDHRSSLERLVHALADDRPA